jgi:hypothetical protein
MFSDVYSRAVLLSDMSNGVVHVNAFF